MGEGGAVLEIDKKKSWGFASLTKWAAAKVKVAASLASAQKLHNCFENTRPPFQDTRVLISVH